MKETEQQEWEGIELKEVEFSLAQITQMKIPRT